ncbi:MAG: thiamine pyrophosphate-dependent dehydrogenase E1 component subunit alpha [Tetrasphaera sp.]
MDLSTQQQLDAYRKMSMIRAFEDRLHKENATGAIPGFIHLYAGEEAIAVGMCENLTRADKIASTHRGHGHCIAKGCDVRGMMLEIYGRKEGLCHGKGGSMHIADLAVGMLGANGIVGGGPPLAIGAALTSKYRKDGSVAVSFTGDGGSNHGFTLEALNMAVVLQLPMVFVFENNGMGEATGADFAIGSKDIASRAGSFGMPSATVDGTDFFDMYSASKEAVTRAREGGGPSVIEATAVRFYGHFEGDPGLYRTPDQLAELKETKDPLVHFRARTRDRISAEDLDAIDAENVALVDAAVAEAQEAALPDLSDVDADVYVSY